jgi:hypothetical protein
LLGINVGVIVINAGFITVNAGFIVINAGFITVNAGFIVINAGFITVNDQVTPDIEQKYLITNNLALIGTGKANSSKEMKINGKEESCNCNARE